MAVCRVCAAAVLWKVLPGLSGESELGCTFHRCVTSRPQQSHGRVGGSSWSSCFMWSVQAPIRFESEGDPPAKGAFHLCDQGHGRGSHGCCVVFGMERAVDFAEVVNEDFGGVVVR